MLAKRPPPTTRPDSAYLPESKRARTSPLQSTVVAPNPAAAFQLRGLYAILQRCLPSLRDRVRMSNSRVAGMRKERLLAANGGTLDGAAGDHDLAQEMDELVLSPQATSRLFSGPASTPSSGPVASGSSLGMGPAVPTLSKLPQFRKSELWESQEAARRLQEQAAHEESPASAPSSLALVVARRGLKRSHILASQNQSRIDDERRRTLTRAVLEPSGQRRSNRGHDYTDGTSTSTPAASASSIGITQTSTNDFSAYRQRVDEVYQSLETAPSHFSSHTAKALGAPRVGFEETLRRAKASLDSPAPPRQDLPSPDTVKLLRRLELSRKRKPRCRKWRTCLDSEKEAVVKMAMATRGEVASLPGAYVEGRDIQKLHPNTWLNDEVINFYGVLINLRSKEAEETNTLEKQGLLRVHCFSSFFMGKYENGGHEAVKRWTKKIDLFTKDIIVFPLNLGNSHWVCAAINIRQKRFEYYDSMGHRNIHTLKKLAAYLAAEHKAKKGEELNLSEWEFDNSVEDVPMQNNGSDCGVFTCQFMEALSSSWKGADTVFDFTCREMPYIRRKIVYEVASKQLLPEEYKS